MAAILVKKAALKVHSRMENQTGVQVDCSGFTGDFIWHKLPKKIIPVKILLTGLIKTLNLCVPDLYIYIYTFILEMSEVLIIIKIVYFFLHFKIIASSRNYTFLSLIIINYDFAPQNVVSLSHDYGMLAGFK